MDDPEERTQTFNLRLSHTERSLLDALAKREGNDRSAVLRRLLREEGYRVGVLNQTTIAVAS